MVIFIPPKFEREGNLKLKLSDKSQITQITPRVSRRRTLNGKVIVEHYGISLGDNSYEFVIKNPKESDYLKLKYWIWKYAKIYVSFRAGVYVCTISNLEFQEDLKIKAYLEEIIK